MKFIKSMFKKGSERVLEEFKKQEDSLSKRKLELELESNQARLNLDQAIAKAADETRQGNPIGIKEALVELAVDRTEAKQITRDRLMNMKSLNVVRMASRKIKTLMGDNKANAVFQVAEIMRSKDVQELIGRHDIQTEECERRIAALFKTNFEDSLSNLNSNELLSEDELLLSELVASQESGNETEVAKLQARLQGAGISSVV